MQFNAITVLSGAVLAASLFFGGGARRDLISDLIPILLSCPLLVLAYPKARLRLGEDRFFLVLLISFLAVIIAQFIPLPPSVWGALPGRAEILDLYAQSGVSPPWASLAIRPGEAAKSALAILPGLALCLAAITLDMAQRRILIVMAIVVALLNAPIGMMQLLGGTSTALYFYEVTNIGSAVGLFANRNHYASLFFCVIPFVAALFASRKQFSGAPSWLIGAICLIILLLGLSISESRSALILGAASLAASVAYVARGQIADLMKGRFAWATVGIVVVAMIPLGMGIGLLTILQRFDAEDLAGDGRVTFAKVTLDAIKAYFPVGSGLGSFQQVYQLREPANTVTEPIINHAHNDWLEVGLELGLAGLALGAAFIVWLAREILRGFSEEGSEGQLFRAALILISLLLIHSIWDYPLRTIAMSALFGLSCGLIFAAPPTPGERPERIRRRIRKRSTTTPHMDTAPTPGAV